jgi:hypothetical protein
MTASQPPKYRPMTSHSEIASTSVERLQHHDHRLPGFADALAESAGLPLGEIEALETAQRSFTRIIASLDDPTVLLALPHTLWPTLESCF